MTKKEGNNKMTRHLMNLRDEKAQIVASAKAALAAGEYEQAEDFKNQIEEINGKIKTTEEILDASSKAALPADPPLKNSGSDEDDPGKLERILNSKEYSKAFFNAMKNGESIKNARKKEEFAPLMNALTETGGTPQGAEGGFLVPVDFNNMIWELRRQHHPLLQYVHVENVNTLSGWRAREKESATATLSPLAELAAANQTAGPRFVRVDYNIAKYGDFLPISDELLEDTPINIMQYLGAWFSKLSVNTENAKIIALLDLLTPQAFDPTKGVASIKTALNKMLDPAISVNSILLTNQSGFDVLDKLEDANKRPLLQPNPTDETMHRVKNREVVVMSDDFLPNDTANNEAPLYIGDLKQYITFFMRKTFEFATTNIGGDAWRTDSTEARGIERFDAQVMDEKAAVKLVIPLT